MENETKPRPTSDDRLASIAAAARDLIAERGFEGLRTRDIAERVGINIATLHYHVPSKEALIGIVAQSMRDDFIAQSRARPRDGLTALQKLELEFSDFRDTAEFNPKLFLVFAELMERSRRDPNVDAHIRPLQVYWHGQIIEILAEGRSDGVFRADMDAQSAALIVLGAMIATRRHPDKSLEHFDRVCAELLRSLRTPHLSPKEN